MAGRKGARPIPPATKTTSPPFPEVTSHPVPNGPRTPSTVPGPAATRAAVTEPTLRMVCSMRSGRFGSPLIEMGASPTPNAYNMVNWPGDQESAGPSVGSSSSVYVSRVSCRVRRTTNGRGSMGSGPARVAGSAAARSTSLLNEISVDIEQPDPGGLEPLVHHPDEPLGQLVPDAWVCVELGPQARSVEGHRAGLRGGPGVERPAVRRHHPRPTHDVPVLERVQHHPTSGGSDLDGHHASPEHVEVVSRFTLVEDELAPPHMHVGGAAGQQFGDRVVQTVEERVLRQILVDGLHVIASNRTRGLGRAVERGRLGGDVDRRGTPGDTPPAADASGCSE